MKDVLYAIVAASALAAYGDWYGQRDSRDQNLYPPRRDRAETENREMSRTHGLGCMCQGCERARDDVRRREEAARREAERREAEERKAREERERIDREREEAWRRNQR